MILSGYIILSASGSISAREPLCLHKTREQAIKLAKATRAKGTYTIANAAQFFKTPYGSGMLALIRERATKARIEGYERLASPLTNGHGVPRMNGNSTSHESLRGSEAARTEAKPLSKFEQMRALLKREKQEKALADKIASDTFKNHASLKGDKLMLSTTQAENKARSGMASKDLLPPDKSLKSEPLKWDLDRLMCRFNAQSLCTQQEIDRRAKSGKERTAALERLNKFAKRNTQATPMDTMLRRMDLLVLFRAGKLPKELKHIAKLGRLALP